MRTHRIAILAATFLAAITLIVFVIAKFPTHPSGARTSLSANATHEFELSTDDDEDADVAVDEAGARGHHAHPKKRHKRPHEGDDWMPTTQLSGFPFEPSQKGELTGKLVMLDPGHGGDDSGAPSKGLLEKDINLAVALKLKDLLVKQGARVVMTRIDDTFIPLDDRAGLSNKLKPDVFLSIHTNDSVHRDTHGVETYFYFPTSEPFAKALLQALATGLTEQSNWAQKNNLRVLDKNTRVASLAEIGYISHEPTHALLARDDYREKIATALCSGIDNYFKSRQ